MEIGFSPPGVPDSPGLDFPIETGSATNRIGSKSKLDLEPNHYLKMDAGQVCSNSERFIYNLSKYLLSIYYSRICCRETHLLGSTQPIAGFSRYGPSDKTLLGASFCVCERERADLHRSLDSLFYSFLAADHHIL